MSKPLVGRLAIRGDSARSVVARAVTALTVTSVGEAAGAPSGMWVIRGRAADRAVLEAEGD